MPYQITQQYTQDDEKFIAEFRLLKDAKAYIQAKLETNLQLKLNIIYRLFDNRQCIKEFNKEKVGALLQPAYYAEGTRLLPLTLPSAFEIDQWEDSTSALAAFQSLSDAKDFAMKKVTEDSLLNVNHTYRLMKDKVVVEVFNQTNIEANQSSGESGKASAISFRPTPLNTSPRPPGTPPSVRDVEPESD